MESKEERNELPLPLPDEGRQALLKLQEKIDKEWRGRMYRRNTSDQYIWPALKAVSEELEPIIAAISAPSSRAPLAELLKGKIKKAEDYERLTVTLDAAGQCHDADKCHIRALVHREWIDDISAALAALKEPH